MSAPKIIACSRRAFHVEIAQFLYRAFPDETAPQDALALMSFVERCHARVEQLGHESEDIVFYWALLSFMGGEDFDADAETSSYLRTTWLSMETKLERIIEQVNLTLKIPELAELIDTEETVAEYEDARIVRWRRRSGKILSDSGSSSK
jgi:hypothetical protein